MDLLINEYLAQVKAGKNETDSLTHYLLNKIAILKKTYPPQVLSPMVETALTFSGVTDKKAIRSIKHTFGINDSVYRAVRKDLSDEEYKTLLQALRHLSPTTDSSLQAIYQNQLVAQETKFDTRLLRDTTKRQGAEIQRAGDEIRQKNRWLWMTVILLLLFLPLGFYLFKRRRQAEIQRKAEEKARLKIEELQKDTDHRFKNTLNRIEAIVSETGTNSTDEHSFVTLEGRVRPLMTLHRMLSRTPSETIGLQGYLQDICNNLQQSYAGDKQISMEVEAPGEIDGERAGILGLIVNEMVTNSFKHAFADRHKGSIQVRLRREAEKQVLHVADNGPGLIQGAKTGSGLEIIESLACQLKGELKQYNRNGSHFELIFS